MKKVVEFSDTVDTQKLNEVINTISVDIKKHIEQSELYTMYSGLVIDGNTTANASVITFIRFENIDNTAGNCRVKINFPTAGYLGVCLELMTITLTGEHKSDYNTVIEILRVLPVDACNLFVHTLAYKECAEFDSMQEIDDSRDWYFGEDDEHDYIGDGEDYMASEADMEDDDTAYVGAQNSYLYGGTTYRE